MNRMSAKQRLRRQNSYNKSRQSPSYWSEFPLLIHSLASVMKFIPPPPIRTPDHLKFWSNVYITNQ